jgi:hypothetical protein
MELRTIIGGLLVMALVLGLGYLVLAVAESATDWVELALIVLAAVVVGTALHERRTARPSRRRTIRRTSESDW